MTLAEKARLRKSAAPIAIGLFVLANVLVSRSEREAQLEHARNFPVAPPTGVGADGRRVRWDWSVGEHLDSYLPLIPDRSSTRLVVIAGMSQMYTVNDGAPGDRIIAEHLDDALRGKARVFGLAAPNLAHEEATFLLTTLLASPRTRPHVFVFAACFDKLRNVDLRPSLASLLQRNDIREQWTKVIAQFGAKYPRATAKMTTTLDASEKANIKDDSVERRLRQVFARALPIVAARKTLNAEMQSALFLLRNAVFRIKPTSKRPILRERYETNREFLELMQDLARTNDVTFVTYVVPLNPSAENPYVQEEYQSFKAWLRGFTASRQVPFANLENVVPVDQWGQFMGGADFKHFRAEGHRLTAAALLDNFGPSFVADK